MNIIIQFLFLLLGGVIFAVGLLTTGNNRFYTWWRDRYWKEPNDGHLTRNSLIYNRYVRGIGMIAIGAVISYIALSQ